MGKHSRNHTNMDEVFRVNVGGARHASQDEAQKKADDFDKQYADSQKRAEEKRK